MKTTLTFAPTDSLFDIPFHWIPLKHSMSGRHWQTGNDYPQGYDLRSGYRYPKGTRIYFHGRETESFMGYDLAQTAYRSTAGTQLAFDGDEVYEAFQTPPTQSYDHPCARRKFHEQPCIIRNMWGHERHAMIVCCAPLGDGNLLAHVVVNTDHESLNQARVIAAGGAWIRTDDGWEITGGDGAMHMKEGVDQI